MTGKGTSAEGGRDDVETLKEDIERLRADVAELARTLRGVLKDRLDTTAGDEAAGAENEWAAFREKLEAARAGSEEAARELRKEVEAHPLASLGVAFGAGYLLARLFK